MRGIVKKVVADKGFGFVKSGDVEYFFHKDDFNGHFSDLCEDLMRGKEVVVDFDIATSTRGPRASNVIRVDSGVA